MDVQQILEEGRPLEPTCAVATSAPARAFKARLRKMATGMLVLRASVYCRHDLVALLRCTLAVGVPPDSRDASGIPILCMAAAHGAARNLKSLLDAGADVKMTAKEDGSSALHQASLHGHAECVRLLLKAKAPLEAGMTAGYTPLLHAAEQGRREIVEQLLKAGASTSARNNIGEMALHLAAEHGSSDVVNLLLSAGSDLEARDNGNFTPLNVAAFNGQVAAIWILLERGANVNAADHHGHTPLMHAILQHHAATVFELLPVSDVSITSKFEGTNAFHMCLSYGNEEVFKLFLPYVADLDAWTLTGTRSEGSTTPFNRPPLHVACTFGQHLIVKTLVRRGASRTALNEQNESALFYAAVRGYLSCAAILLGQPGAFKMSPAEVNLVNQVGWTALHYGARYGHLCACGLLMQAGASLDAANAKGKTPLMLAQKYQPANAPLLSLLSGNWTGPLPGTACERCAAVPESALLHCSGCLSVRYCCPRCATADWPRHAAFCKERREVRETSRRREVISLPTTASGTEP